LRFDCPYCRKNLNLLDLQLEADLSAVIAMQVVFGRHQHLVWTYLELFQVRPLNMKVKKLRLILEEMKTLFQAEEFAYQKKRYRISPAGIAEALNIMVHKNFPEPLENHNYLKKVMIGISDREERGESKQEEKDLRKKEAGLMSGSRDAYPVPAEHVLPPMKSIPPLHLTEEQIAENKRKTRELLKSIGG